MINKHALKQHGFTELAAQFSDFIQRLDKTDNEHLALAAALLSEAESQGHVCLNLATISEHHRALLSTMPVSKELWIQALKQSHVVGNVGEVKPLILTEEGVLYLYRYHHDECFIADAIRQRCQPLDLINADVMTAAFSQWHTQHEGVNWQKAAVFMALTRQFCVISGGPGTGKTTIVLRLLQMLLAQETTLKIALAAPTGKAAARLQLAVSEHNNSGLSAKTLHRLLGITAENEQGRYHAKRPLVIDVVIVDEASMIDMNLMAILLRALPSHARLILLGDSHQLASVEAGAVLASLCEHGDSFSTSFKDNLKQITSEQIESITNNNTPNSSLTDSIVTLKHNYRFNHESTINRLAIAVQSGELGNVYDVLRDEVLSLWVQNIESTTIQNHVIKGYADYFDAIKAKAPPLECLQLFEQYRVLCALKTGSHSVVSVNNMIEKRLQAYGIKTHQTFYHGRPIMIGRNDYQQRLFNGDIGLILYDKQGVLRACFKENNQLRWVNLTRLPAHETVFAMTIHKSQGSEFDIVSILLPEEENPLLNRELLYTAITRAKKDMTIISSAHILNTAIETQHQRETGLSALLG